MANTQETILSFPSAGLNTNAGYDAQPENTTPDCMNVMAFDASASRQRGGQRRGFAAQAHKLNAANFAVNRLHQVTATVANVSLTRLIGVTGGTDRSVLWTTDPTGSWALTTGGSNAIQFGAGPDVISSCDILGKLYLVDGTSLLSVDCNQATPVTTSLTTPGGNQWTQTSTGSDINGTSDQFNFAYQSITGDFDVKVQIPAFSYNSPYARGGIMARAGTGATDAYMSVMVQPNSPYYMVFRTAAAGATTFAGGSQNYTGGANNWVRLKKATNTFTAYSSVDGVNWTQIYTVTSAIGATLNVGYALTGHALSASMTFQNLTAPSSTFTDIDIGSPSPAGSLTTATSTVSGSIPTGATIACNFMGRLALSGMASDPQNIFFSRGSVPADFDYSQTDPLAAVALNSSATIGRVGQWIKALIPWNRDELLIGGQHSIFVLNGNPVAGGTIDTVSDSVGIVGPNAWCTDPLGNVYFVGTGGLYQIPAHFRQTLTTLDPTNLSLGKIDQYLANLLTSTTSVKLAYDAVKHGVWMFFTKSGGGSTHLYYDLRTQAFFPQQFATASDDPQCAIAYNAYDSGAQAVLTGNSTSQVLIPTDGQKTDNGSAISSRVSWIMRPAGQDQGTMTAAQLYLAEQGALGSSDLNVVFAVQAAKTLYDALNNPDRSLSVTATAFGRQVWIRNRITGGGFTFRLSNSSSGKTWAMERIIPSFVKAGIQR